MRRAAGRRQGRRHDPRRHHRLRRLARAVPPQRGRLARVRRHPRRVPDLHEPAGHVSCRGSRRAGSRTPTRPCGRSRSGKGVKFHNGKTLTAQDVVASMKQYVREKGSNAGLTPYFDAAASRRRGDYTVVFRLKSPIGVFPYLVSQTTYQAIIQPAAIAAQPGGWVKAGMIGTGAFKRQELRRQEERDARPQRRLLGRPAAARRRQGHLLPGQRADRARAARQGRSTSRCSCRRRRRQPFKNNSRFTYYAQPTSAHRQVCMRTDQALRFEDARVRRAVALVDQPAAAARARSCSAPAQIGNDTPFWRGFASTDPSVQQRTQNLDARARRCCAAAGRENLKFNLTTWNFLDHTRSRRVHPGLRA